MSFLVLLGSLFALAFSLVLINRYFSFKLHKNTYPLTLCITLFNMIILLSTTYLLPLDLFYAALASNRDSNDGNDSVIKPPTNSTAKVVDVGNGLINLLSLKTMDEDVKQSDFRSIWLSIYWSEFILCWLIIPVLISYVSFKYAVPLGEIRTRINKAVLQNLKFYSLSLVCIIIGAVYLIVSTGHNLFDFKPLLVSLAHIYSLSYALILLSTGLIIFPKDLMLHGNLPTENSNNRLFVELSKTNDDMNDSQLSMMENANIIITTNELQNGDVTFNEVLNSCKLEINSMISELRMSDQRRTLPIPVDSSTSSLTSIDKLNSTYNKFITHYYNYLYSQTYSDNIIHKLAHTESPYYSNVKRVLSVIIGFLCMLISLLVFLLEIIPTRWVHDWIFSDTKWYNFGLQFIFISYAMLVSLYAMSKFKFSNFHLIPNGRSNPSNTLYYSLYSSRLLFPICFNLMTLVPSRNNSERIASSFETTLYNDLALIPLIDFLNRFAPVLFLIIVPLSYKYDLKEKVLLKALGEEYYYQFFGMMMYEPVNDRTSMGEGDPLESDSRRRMDEDYNYSLQDGRYLFESASSNYTLAERS